MTCLAERYHLSKLPVIDLDAFIISLCRDKRVLHLGCANWPITKELYRTESLLYQHLDGNCAELDGVDISEEGIEYLKRKGLNPLFVADATDYDKISTNITWTPEITIAPELIEHMEHPDILLSKYAKQMP